MVTVGLVLGLFLGLAARPKVGQPFQNGGQMRLSRAARGPELQTKTQNEDAYYYNRPPTFIANQANQ